MNWTLAIPFLVLAGGNFAWGEARKSETTAATWRYFRFDGGVASPGCGPLPDKFDMPGGLRWKAPMDPGQSSPIVANGRIFLTTYGAEAKELATVALDLATGKTMWKRVVPVSRIETFHPQMGSAAVATPAWDGARLFVFFGSYGLIRL